MKRRGGSTDGFEWQNGQETSLAGAVVIITLPSTWLDTSKPYDVVRGGGVIGKATTDQGGKFTVNVPAGTYNMIIWKEHYVPQGGVSAIAPGTVNGSISPDRQPGWTGRHMHLEYQ